MKRQTTNQRHRTLTLGLTLLAVLTVSMLLVPQAYGQQEVSPTWYDPWPVSNKVAVQPSQPRAAAQKQRQKSISVSQHRPGKKVRVKRPGNRQAVVVSKPMPNSLTGK